MPESSDPHDPSWYRDRWNDLMELFSVSDPEDVLPHVQELQEAQNALSHSNFRRLPDALQAIENMEEQLSVLYDEKTAAHQSAAQPHGSPDTQDTYEQLHSHLAREEKVCRTLGVPSIDAVITMVEQLAEQLNVLYAERDADADAPPVAKSNGPSNNHSTRLQSELGVSDPDAIVAMVRSLSQQLNELYSDRKRLVDADLSDSETTLEMLRSMQRQLEALYEQQDRLADHGLHTLDHALALINSMDEQLVDLYTERQQHPAGEPLLSPETLHRLDDMDPDALEDVPVGALCIDTDGVICRANTEALEWPDLSASRVEDLVGTPFAHAAPRSTDAFDDLLTEGPRDTRVLYAHTGTDTATTLLVQLYCPPNRSVCWILFRPT
ncbi:MAG: hypothetical protein R6T83_04705 [Salinibacter sp.]